MQRKLKLADENKQGESAYTIIGAEIKHRNDFQKREGQGQNRTADTRIFSPPMYRDYVSLLVVN
jgi:hypothetical protein